MAHDLYTQFDTGAPQSNIYEKDTTLRALGLDIKKAVIDDMRYVERIDFILDGNRIKTTMIKIYSFKNNSLLIKHEFFSHLSH